MFDPVLTGEVARLLDVSEETVRAYDRRGVLRARRTSSGVRIFDRDDVERLRRSRAEHHHPVDVDTTARS